MRFVKIPAILSKVPDLSCVIFRKWHRENRETISIVKPLSRILAGLLHLGVCVTWQSHQGLRRQEQIHFAEGIALTRFTTRVLVK